MLNAGEKMYSYIFKGYWKDVGTISSLWEANMDLLGAEPVFDVDDHSWKIHSRSALAPPVYVGNTGKLVNSMMSPGCEIDGTVERSILGCNVVVEKGAKVVDSVIMANTVVKAGATVNYSIVDEGVTIEAATVGEQKDKATGIAVLGAGIKIGAGATVKGGDILDKDVKGE